MSVDRTFPKSRRATLAAIAVVTTLAACAIAACGSEADDDASVTGNQDGGEGGNADGTISSSSGNLNDGGPPPLGDGSIPDECANAPDADIDCTGKCGPVKDFCTGRVKQCGGCPDLDPGDGGKKEVQACDLTTNTCTKPKVTCSDLGAECGTVKNTCGKYLDCPDTPTKGCGDGKECDPDTNKCRDCQEVTCKDLGYECGFAWLGCGPDDAAHQTDCGQCADGPGGEKRTCNAQFHKCEPKCTPPKTTAEKKAVCDAAKASIRKVECGVISDGCGGTIDCTTVSAEYKCKSGESCGVHGLPNRCYPDGAPDECRAQGRQCGTIKSACDGTTVNCGKCADGEVCNENGICGVPCSPKKCDTDFKDLECGTFDDGCGGTVTCGTCPGGVCDQSTNTCCKAKSCSADYKDKCGDDLPTGCGTATIDCNCGSPKKCTTNGGDSPAPPKGNPGTCCTPKTASSYAGQCGKKLSNGCGGTIDVGCPTNLFCVNNQEGKVGEEPPPGVAGTCCTPQGSCDDEAAGKCESIPNSCRPNGQPPRSCSDNCKGSTPSCVGGNCCTPAAACGTNECNVTKPGNGCGSDRVCACPGGRTCLCDGHPCGPDDTDPGVCTAALTCSQVAGANGCGTDLDNGVGGTIDCGCGTGHKCSETAPGKVGTCKCDNGTDNPYTCANVPGGPGKPGGDACGSFPDGCGKTLNCTCESGKSCQTGPNPNVCCVAAAACTGSGGEGGECNVTHPGNGCGNDRTCNCAGGRTCWCGDHACKSTDGAGTCKAALTCSSAPYNGKCGTNLSNGVGGTINCGCGAGHVCSETGAGKVGVCHCQNGTDTPLACPATPGEGTMCGQNIDNQCGGKINCGCPSGANNTNWTCGADNKCHCVKDTCRGRTGPQPDLCGGQLQCGG